ncbi:MULTISPECIES: DUF4223 family protein [unclassified Moritella]|uniref:DUF4223 family protein n=1 Tax=unclassified Moritella TaxID=2637987 RepID=UPI001BAD30E3|nr:MULTISPECIES: DUF4223 family protein [unclassified Moritella]QUM82002.1 DUF4223 family protein [Moritella sp. 5]QUM86288.1 DUF4223 family protein [Moritella sp. 28]QUM90503.1 DUF4223 family protein [Moritella sp. 36]
MKNVLKLAGIALTFMALSGCTGTTYNKEKDCSADYLLVPALSIPTMIGACES